jgi:acyl-CoA synthetase (NDP forming)
MLAEPQLTGGWPVTAASSVALVGARPGAIATDWLPRNLRAYGATGEIWLVSRRHAGALGDGTYASTDDLPDVPEVLVLAVGPVECIRLTRQFTARGTRLVIVYANGFSETGTAEGRRLERELAAAVQGDALLIGPSSLGAADFRAGLCAFGPPLPADLRTGCVSLVSQSGALLSSMLGAASDEGFGVDWCAAVGSGARFGVAAALDYALSRPDTKVVGVYFEGFGTAADLAQLTGPLAMAADSGQRVVAVRAGVSAAGASVAVSHTGTIGGDDRLVDAFFRRYGVIRADSLAGLVRTVNVLRLDQARRKPRAAREGLAIIEPSGGATAIAADLASTEHVPLAVLSAATQSFLAEVGGTSAHVSNPVDLTAGAHDPATVDRAYGLIHDDQGVGAVLIPWSVSLPDSSSARRYHRDSLSRHVRLAAASGVPVVIATSAPQRWTSWAREQQQELPPNMAIVQGVAPTMRALRSVLASDHRAAEDSLDPAAAGPRLKSRSRPGQVLEEERALRLLAAAGIPVARSLTLGLGELGTSADRTAAAALRPPFAVKVIASGLAHKAAAGGVRLGVPGPAQVPAAAGEVLSGARKAGVADTDLGGVLVAEMAFGPELMVGLSRDAVYGDYLVLGWGGVLTEAVGGHALELIDERDPGRAADAAIASLDRGGLASQALAAARPAIVALCAEFTAGSLRHCRTVEVNPLIAGQQDVIAADALAIVDAEDMA